METFTATREFEENPRYFEDRQEALGAVDLDAIDRPIVDLIEGFASLPQCFTIQCCYGHFLYAPGQSPCHLERLPAEHSGEVTYRIAYMAFCIENSPRGRALRDSLETLTRIDPDCVQFGSADWFRNRHRNCYVLQVEPERHKTEDQVVIEHSEALHIQKVRDTFFLKMRELVKGHLGEQGTG
jgi:hypothetical protein